MNVSVLLNHFLVVGGFLLAILILGRILREHRPPGNTLAWILAIILIPYVGVPLYLLFGGKKLRKFAAMKDSVDEPSPREITGTQAERLLITTGTPSARNGNRVLLLPGNAQAAKALFDNIESAKESIYIETFILSRDEIGRKLVDALVRKAKEGVKVKLLLDAWGSWVSDGRFVNPLRKAGGEVGVFLPILPTQRRWSLNLRNHRKIWIVDEKRAVIGGRNIGKEYLEDGGEASWDDFNVAIEGPAVGDLCRIFASDWNFATGKTLEIHSSHDSTPGLENKGCLQIVASGPDTPANRLYEGILASLLETRQRLWIVTPYFVPDETLVQSLSLAARLGRDVRIIVPVKSNHAVADFARGSYLRELRRNGVKVYGFKEMIHTKLMLFDDRSAVVGSANLDLRSLLLNYEVAAFCYSPEEIQQISRHILEILASCEPLELESTNRKDRLRIWFEDIGRLFAPLL